MNRPWTYLISVISGVISGMVFVVGALALATGDGVRPQVVVAVLVALAACTAIAVTSRPARRD